MSWRTSDLELGVRDLLTRLHVPFDDDPASRTRSVSGKDKQFDLFLPDSPTWVEVKGFMTVAAISEMARYARQTEFRYYVFQGTESLWDPQHGEFGNPGAVSEDLRGHVRAARGKKRPMFRDRNLVDSVARQARELQWLVQGGASRLSVAEQNLITLDRLREYVHAIIKDEGNSRTYSNWLTRDTS